ncbi:hypothetical protein AAC387_Pa06g1013 [Persea americana]
MGVVVLISLLFCCSVVLLSWIWKLFYKIWWKPMKLQRCLNEQGIYGHPIKLLYGNLRDMVSSMRQAQSQPINLTHKIVPRVIPFLHQTVKSYGLAKYECEKWAKHRRILNPAFHQEKLKRMVPAMITSCTELISRWEKLVGSEGSYSEREKYTSVQNRMKNQRIIHLSLMYEGAL